MKHPILIHSHPVPPSVPPNRTMAYHLPYRPAPIRPDPIQTRGRTTCRTAPYHPSGQKGWVGTPLGVPPPASTPTRDKATATRHTHPMPPGNWTPDERQTAIQLLRDSTTLADTHRQTGIPKQTLSGWAKDEAIDLGRTTEKIREAVAARNAQQATRRADLADALLALAELAVPVEVDMIDSADLRDVVGSRTRAIHDMQLLTGQPTDRTETVTQLDRELEELTAALSDGADDPVPAE